MSLSEGEYRVLADGWIKIARADWEVGLRQATGQGRLLLGLNQLLIRNSGKTILVDTGLGDKWSSEQIGLLDYQQPRQLMHELSIHGVRPESVDIVVFSHLHYDHSGGGTLRKGNLVAPSFPNAVYYVQSIELESAKFPIPGKESDYCREDFIPLEDSGQLRLIDGSAEIIPGVEVHLAPGHSPGHQVVKADLAGETVFFPGDLFSTPSHANLQVSMIYDDDRSILINERRRWLVAARQGKWRIVYCHAARNPVGVLGSMHLIQN